MIQAFLGLIMILLLGSFLNSCEDAVAFTSGYPTEPPTEKELIEDIQELMLDEEEYPIDTETFTEQVRYTLLNECYYESKVNTSDHICIVSFYSVEYPGSEAVFKFRYEPTKKNRKWGDPVSYTVGPTIDSYYRYTYGIN